MRILDRTPLLVALAATGVALATLPTFQVGAYMDDGLYICIGKALASGQGYRRLDLPGAPLTTFVPPGYPMLLAPFLLLFPNSFLPLQLLSVAFSAGTLLLWSTFLRGRTSRTVAILALVLTGCHNGFITHASMVMTEAPYLFFSLLALVALDRVEGRDKAFAAWGGLLILASAMCALIRVPGLILVGSVCLVLILRRGPAKGLAFALGTGLPVGLWFCRNWWVAGALVSKEYEEASVSSNLSSYLDCLRSTIPDYLAAVPHTLMPLWGPKMASALGPLHPVLFTLFNLAVWAAVAVGFTRSLFRRWGGHHLYAACLLGVLLLFRSYGDERLILPLAPFLILWTLEGVDLIGLHLSKVMHAPRVALLLLAACSGSIFLLHAYRDLQGIRHPVRERIPDIALGATWIRDNAPQEAIVMAQVPRSTFLYAERSVAPFPISVIDLDARTFYGSEFFSETQDLTEAQRLEAALEEAHVNYLLLAPTLETSPVPKPPQLAPYAGDVALPLVNVQPDRFSLVYSNPKAQVFVYEDRHRCLPTFLSPTTLGLPGGCPLF